MFSPLFGLEIHPGLFGAVWVFQTSPRFFGEGVLPGYIWAAEIFPGEPLLGGAHMWGIPPVWGPTGVLLGGGGKKKTPWGGTFWWGAPNIGGAFCGLVRKPPKRGEHLGRASFVRKNNVLFAARKNERVCVVI